VTFVVEGGVCAPTKNHDAIWQPAYADFDISGIDLGAESNSVVSIHQADQAGLPPLPGGLGSCFAVTPEQPFETPQRVWLPILLDVEPGAVCAYYWLADEKEGHWVPAEDIDGWMVPGSYLVGDFEGVAYLGFLVRHAGVIQLGPLPEDEKPKNKAAAILAWPQRGAISGDLATFLAIPAVLFLLHRARRRTDVG
jgi:hypothetical protein